MIAVSSTVRNGLLWIAGCYFGACADGVELSSPEVTQQAQVRRDACNLEHPGILIDCSSQFERWANYQAVHNAVMRDSLERVEQLKVQSGINYQFSLQKSEPDCKGRKLHYAPTVRGPARNMNRSYTPDQLDDEVYTRYQQSLDRCIFARIIYDDTLTIIDRVTSEHVCSWSQQGLD